KVSAEMADGKLRKTIPDLRRALCGRCGDHHALLIGMRLDHIDHLEATMARLDTEIDAVFASNTNEAGIPFEQARDHLGTIPGVAKRAAEAILAEIGVDMSRFPQPGTWRRGRASHRATTSPAARAARAAAPKATCGSSTSSIRAHGPPLVPATPTCPPSSGASPAA